MHLSSPFLSWKKAGLVALCIGAAISAIKYTPLYDILEEKITMPVNFQTRAWLGKGPGLDPRIKIYSYDDRSFDYIGDSDLAINEWAKVFKVFADRGAQAIIVDKMFDAKRPSEAESKEFKKRIEALGIPVTSGVFFSKNKKFRAYSVDYSKRSVAIPGGNQLPISDFGVFGPYPPIEDAFSNLGHFTYNREGKTQAFVRLDDNVIVPHIGMFVNKPLSLENIPMTKDGSVQVNLDEQKVYRESNWTLRDPVALAMNNIEKNMPIVKGDFVLILPGMYAGNFDQVETPFGKMPGGFVVAAILQSALTGKWLKPVSGDEYYVLLASILGAVIVTTFSSLLGWFFLLAGVGSVFCAGVSAFAYSNLMVPWLLPTGSMFLSGVFCLSLKSRAFEKNAMRLTSALGGVVSKDRLRDIIRDPQKLDLTPNERYVTVMFVDIVGFSIIAERLSPEEAFRHLRNLFSKLGAMVHSFGGVVDSTPGDGLLCYFGYNFDGTSVGHHEDQALKCAIEIQRQSVKQILEAQGKNEPTFPLRIGINSDTVYVGDLGGMRQIKLTVIGHAVNFAKRLESSCDYFCIMIGQKTKKKLSRTTDFTYRIERRPIQIKHHAEMIEAYEADPFMHDLTLRGRALQAYRSYLGVERKTDRFAVAEEFQITINCEIGIGVLTNFSETGIAVRMSQYIGKEVNLPIQMDSPGSRLNDELERRGITNLIAEVRWGRPDGERYLHGLYIKNLNPKQRASLMACLVEFTDVRRSAV